MCQYEQAYKKPTRLVTNCDALLQLRCSCSHVKHAQVLQGKVWDAEIGWTNRTTRAGSYPETVCKKWAQSVSAAVKPRCYDTKKLSASFDQVVHQVREDKCRSPEGHPEARCPHVSQGPKVLEAVVFGHHSKAEAAKRRLKRIHQESCQKKKMCARACHQSA